jgi:hypothetical protein
VCFELEFDIRSCCDGGHVLWCVVHSKSFCHLEMSYFGFFLAWGLVLYVLVCSLVWEIYMGRLRKACLRSSRSCISVWVELEEGWVTVWYCPLPSSKWVAVVHYPLYALELKGFWVTVWYCPLPASNWVAVVHCPLCALELKGFWVTVWYCPLPSSYWVAVVHCPLCVLELIRFWVTVWYCPLPSLNWVAVVHCP